MANTEKQEDVIQEVENTEVAVAETNEEQKPAEEKPSYSEKTEDGTIKLDLSKLKQFQDESTEKQGTDEVPVRDEPDFGGEVSEENVEKTTEEPTEESKEEEKEEIVLEEVTDETDTTDETGVVGGAENADAPPQQEEILQEKETQEPAVTLPENIQEVVKFMEETGGSLEDYVRLSADYSNIDNDTLLKEYYKTTKPHLNMEEINFLMEDNFQFDEELDEPRDIKKKKLAFKEEIAKAKKHLTGLKDQYYKEVKLGSKLTPEQQEAVSFYNKYNQEQEALIKNQKASADHFKKATDAVFNQNFKGFDFNVGEKTYRFKVNDVSGTREYQSDILNFVGEFLDEKNMMTDAKAYHKALYAAKNIDKIVKHFYDQGRADAVKQTAMDAKNIDMGPRKAAPVVEAGGMKVRVIQGDDSSRLKFKVKK